MDSRLYDIYLPVALTLCLGLYAGFCFFSISLAQIFGVVGLLLYIILTVRRGYSEKPLLYLLFPFLTFISIHFISMLVNAPSEIHWGSVKKYAEPLIFLWSLNALQKMKLPSLRWIRERTPWKTPFALANLKTGEWLPSPAAIGVLMSFMILIAAWEGLRVIDFSLRSIANHGFLTPRPYGDLNNPITLSIVLMMTGLLGLARVLFYSRWRGVFSTLLILILIALGLTLSREAWVGFFVGALLLFGMKGRNYLRIPIIIAILVYLFSPPLIKNRIETMVTLEDFAVRSRLGLWQGGLDIALDHPVLGCGPNCVERIGRDYREHLELRVWSSLHNTPLQLVVDIGLLGLAAWCWIWIQFYRKLRESFRQNSGSARGSPEWVRRGGAAVVLAFLIASLFEYHQADQEIVMVLYFIMGAALTRPAEIGGNLKIDPAKAPA